MPSENTTPASPDEPVVKVPEHPPTHPATNIFQTRKEGELRCQSFADLAEYKIATMSFVALELAAELRAAKDQRHYDSLDGAEPLTEDQLVELAAKVFDNEESNTRDRAVAFLMLADELTRSRFDGELVANVADAIYEVGRERYASLSNSHQSAMLSARRDLTEGRN